MVTPKAKSNFLSYPKAGHMFFIDRSRITLSCIFARHYRAVSLAPKYPNKKSKISKIDITKERYLTILAMR